MEQNQKGDIMSFDTEFFQTQNNQNSTYESQTEETRLFRFEKYELRIELIKMDFEIRS